LRKIAFLAIISISGSMILIPYVLSSLFLAKLAWLNKKNKTDQDNLKTRALLVGVIASVYGFWLLYAAGLKYILLSTILYALGIFVYKIAWKEKDTNEPMFKPAEKIIAIIIVILAAGSLFMLLSGVFPIDRWVHWFQHHLIETI